MPGGDIRFVNRELLAASSRPTSNFSASAKTLKSARPSGEEDRHSRQDDYCTYSGCLFYSRYRGRIYLIIQNDEIQQAQKREEKGLPKGKAKSRKSETKKYQRHRYQLCSEMYVRLYMCRKEQFTDKQQQLFSNSKASPKPVARPAHFSTTTSLSSTAKTMISEKMLSLFSLIQSPRRQRHGRSLPQSSSPKLNL